MGCGKLVLAFILPVSIIDPTLRVLKAGGRERREAAEGGRFNHRPDTEGTERPSPLNSQWSRIATVSIIDPTLRVLKGSPCRRRGPALGCFNHRPLDLPFMLNEVIATAHLQRLPLW